MKPYALATVLVKLLGLSNIIGGITQATSGVSAACRAIALENQSSVSRHLVGDVLSTMLPFGLLYLGIGIFLLLKTPYVVQKILKISPDE